jgi:hypothetical protein
MQIKQLHLKILQYEFGFMLPLNNKKKKTINKFDGILFKVKIFNPKNI